MINFIQPKFFCQDIIGKAKAVEINILRARSSKFHAVEKPREEFRFEFMEIYIHTFLQIMLWSTKSINGSDKIEEQVPTLSLRNLHQQAQRKK